MNIRTLILAILNAKDASGYEIKKWSSDGRFSHFVDVSFGSIYPTLARLEKDGMVTCRAEAQSGKPDRKVYSITAAGRQEFASALKQPPLRDKFKSEFLLVAMHADMAGEPAIRHALAERMAWLEKEIETLRDVAATCGHPATMWAVEYGLSCMNHDLAYLRNHAEKLADLAKTAPREAAE